MPKSFHLTPCTPTFEIHQPTLLHHDKGYQLMKLEMLLQNQLILRLHVRWKMRRYDIFVINILTFVHHWVMTFTKVHYANYFCTVSFIGWLLWTLIVKQSLLGDERLDRWLKRRIWLWMKIDILPMIWMVCLSSILCIISMLCCTDPPYPLLQRFQASGTGNAW